MRALRRPEGRAAGPDGVRTFLPCGPPPSSPLSTYPHVPPLSSSSPPYAARLGIAESRLDQDLCGLSSASRGPSRAELLARRRRTERFARRVPPALPLSDRGPCLLDQCRATAQTTIREGGRSRRVPGSLEVGATQRETADTLTRSLPQIVRRARAYDRSEHGVRRYARARVHGAQAQRATL